ncbi:hypothetical protein [Microbacterium kunmingense]|uniref:hypothetical protein n=1 Tax=Microbacterium kunmingense TaxID=2915939 RepID=UPI003D71A1A7
MLPPVLTLFTAAPLAAGLTIAAVMGRWWRSVFVVAAIVAVILEIGSIFTLTIPADFDTGSTLALSLCHIAMAPVTVIALFALRGRRRSQVQKASDG